MSTKIWTAWAIKPRLDPWDVCMALRKAGVMRAQKLLTTVYDDMVKHPQDYLSKDAQKLYGTPKSFIQAADVVYRLYREQRGKPERNLWDLDVSFTLRRADTGRWLIVPYPGSGLLSSALDFMRRHRSLVDYHYQNQTDRPDNISARQWSERARTWSPLLVDARWHDFFTVEVMSVNGFFSTCPAMNRQIKAFAAARKKKR